MAKSVREKYKPSSEGSFDLTCPKLDEAMARRWMNARNLTKLNDFQEKSLKSLQDQMLRLRPPPDSDPSFTVRTN